MRRRMRSHAKLSTLAWFNASLWGYTWKEKLRLASLASRKWVLVPEPASTFQNYWTTTGWGTLWVTKEHGRTSKGCNKLVSNHQDTKTPALVTFWCKHLRIWTNIITEQANLISCTYGDGSVGLLTLLGKQCGRQVKKMRRKGNADDKMRWFLGLSRCLCACISMFVLV